MVSVIIPCYNVEDYIEECLHSVLNQSYKDLEIICVDNNSNDKTVEVIKKLKVESPLIKLFIELKPGANAARNKGLAEAKGSWVQFLDADDLLEAKKIEHQISLLSDIDQGVSFVAGAFKRKDGSGNLEVIDKLEKNELIGVFKNQAGNTCSNLWSRSAIQSIGGWNEDLKSSQEADLMLRLILANGKYILDSKPMTIVRERSIGQISKSDPIKRWKTYIDVQFEFIEKLRLLKPEVYKEYIGFYQDAILVSIIILGGYDILEADNYYNKEINEKWNSTYSFGFTKLKVGLIKFIGIKWYIRIFAKNRF